MHAPCAIRHHPLEKSLLIASVCVHFSQQRQLWAGCTGSGQLFLWHADHSCTSQRISLPGASGITCMIQVKNQVSFRIGRQGKCPFLTAACPRCPPLILGMGGLQWRRWCHRSIWGADERSGDGDGPWELQCDKRAAGPQRQHPDTVLGWGPLHPEWFHTPGWQDCHLECGVKIFNACREKGGGGQTVLFHFVSYVTLGFWVQLFWSRCGRNHENE